MEIELQSIRGKPNLTIRYENDEWPKLEKVLRDRLNLVVHEVANAWNMGKKLSCYTEKNEDLKFYLLNTISQELRCQSGFDVFDDINKPISQGRSINIAVLRIVPSGNRVNIPLDNKYLTIAEVNKIARVLSEAVRALLEIVNETKIKIAIIDESVTADGNK
jgi:hypothetical protein